MAFPFLTNHTILFIQYHCYSVSGIQAPYRQYVAQALPAVTPGRGAAVPQDQQGIERPPGIEEKPVKSGPGYVWLRCTSGQTSFNRGQTSFQFLGEVLQTLNHLLSLFTTCTELPKITVWILQCGSSQLTPPTPNPNK
jgi:hypothetical protein